MLSCRRLPLTNEEAAKIKQWLLLPESFVFRNLLQAEIGALQVSAINAQVDALQYPTRQIDQEQDMQRIHELKTVLKLIELYANDPSQLSLCEINVQPIT